MNPGLRPSKLRKDSSFAKFKEIWGWHQNKSDKKKNPPQKGASQNWLGLQKYTFFMQKIGDS